MNAHQTATMIKNFLRNLLIIFGLIFIFPKDVLFAYYINPNVPIINQNATTDRGTSNCVVVKVGNPKDPVVLPANCNYNPGGETPGLDGLIYPPGFQLFQENPNHPGYYRLPQSSSEAYKIYTCAGRTWGSKELIAVLYTVAERWKQKYPQGWISVGDLNATGHKSHNWGRAVDIDATTNGKDCVADYTTQINAGNISCSKANYNYQATAELGKILVDTNLVLNIWYNDPTVNFVVINYAHETERSKNINMHPIAGHDNHFHLDINVPKLGYWTPGC